MKTSHANRYFISFVQSSMKSILKRQKKFNIQIKLNSQRFISPTCPGNPIATSTEKYFTNPESSHCHLKVWYERSMGNLKIISVFKHTHKQWDSYLLITSLSPRTFSKMFSTLNQASTKYQNKEIHNTQRTKGYYKRTEKHATPKK